MLKALYLRVVIKALQAPLTPAVRLVEMKGAACWGLKPVCGEIDIHLPLSCSVAINCTGSSLWSLQQFTEVYPQIMIDVS